MNRALFLDRDGVINEDYGYVHKIEDFHFREGIFDVCRAAQKARMKIIVVTNQAGIGRGYYSTNDYQILNEFMRQAFSARGICIQSVYHCPYHPTFGVGVYKRQSYCRKPSPGMLLQACREHNINPALSVMIGDRDSDMAAACSMAIRWFVNASKSSWVKESIKVIDI